jgi:hypothetical protein
MVMTTPHPPRRVFETLRREIDAFPSFLRSLFTLNARCFVGTSAVCGRITETGFELRNRKGPGFSLRATGTLEAVRGGSTEIRLSFSKPVLPDLIGVLVFDRYRWDRQAIVSFLERYLAAVERKAPKAP